MSETTPVHDPDDDESECSRCDGEGFIFECFDGFCEDADVGCDDCTRPCPVCNRRVVAVTAEVKT